MMKLKWQWWITDIICLFLVILSLYCKENEVQNVITLTPKSSSAMSNLPETSDTILSRNSVTHSPKNFHSVFSPKKKVGIASSSQTNDYDLGHMNKLSASENYFDLKSQSSSATSSPQTNETPITIDELRNCLRNNDLRTALYCARDLLSDPSTHEMPILYYTMGRILCKIGNFPDSIRLLEKGLVLNEESSQSQDYRCNVNMYLALSYYKIGNDDKAWQCFNEADYNARDQMHVQELDKIKNILEGKAPSKTSR